MLRTGTTSALRLGVRATRRRIQHLRNLRATPESVFTEVYQRNLWGGAPGSFNSGSGSVDAVSERYCEYVRGLINDRAITYLADLGCGDFQVGKRIVGPDVDYLGIDVVPSLIEHNQRQYGSDNVRFRHADITRDDLPEAGLILIRQVFQHLSNAQILRVLKALPAGVTLLVTEHFPSAEHYDGPNRDKVHGADTRVHYRSAVDISAYPFNVEGARTVVETHVPNDSGRGTDTIRTVMIESYVPIGE